eukprot:TRINITY_DN6707_c0_g1_i1.p1 TRINITY_DN6707_c0_g1~~TRINITY_DN6707_c0_g1_i1.p1  ORF type:complete len:856 (+),score=106.21 TRINITY_DN6707_c0_g1_i1:38-2605(+)
MIPILLSLTVSGLLINWEEYLSQYSMQWSWRDLSATTVSLQDSRLAKCGEGGCCLTVLPDMSIVMANCTGDASQQWIFKNQTMKNVMHGQCVQQIGNNATLGSCDTTKLDTRYGNIFVNNTEIMSTPPPCLQVSSKYPFCDGTICPRSSLSNITTGAVLEFGQCFYGSRSQMFNLDQLLPNDWTNAPYIGNGELGTRFQYATAIGSASSSFQLVLDNSYFGSLSKRYPAGYFDVTFGKSLESKGLLSHNLSVQISNGLMTGSVATAEGEPLVTFQSYVHATDAVLVFDVRSSVEGFEPEFVWVAQNGTHPSFAEFVVLKNTTAAATLVATVGQSSKLSSSRVTSAVSQLTSSPQKFFDTHRDWWLEYWNSSFISVPDPLIEENYYTQLYRFASSDRVAIHGLDGDFGPTNEFNFWPDTVWDMNEQVMYWITEGSNKPQLVTALLKAFINGSTSHGGLWMMDKIDKHILAYGNELSPQLGMSQQKLLTALFSELETMLKQQVGLNTSKHDTGNLKEDHSGIYHLENCASPEYRCYAPFESRSCDIKTDCNYGLSQLRWGLRRVLELSTELQIPLQAEAYWSRLLASSLVPYPVDAETGFMLSAECPFHCPHRHFSHLLMMYDLELISDSYKSIAERSLDNWYGLSCNASNVFNEECRGFTQCGMAMMSATLGRKDAAVGNLTNVIVNNFSPNGMYGESVFFDNPSMFSPVSESGYCTAAVTNTALFHVGGYDGVLRLFYSVPDSWRSAQFYQLRTKSGHLVSSKMSNQTVLFLVVSSKHQSAVSSLLVSLPWGVPAVVPAPISFTFVSGSVWNLTVQPHVDVTVFQKGVVPNTTFAPLPSHSSHYFGYARPQVPIH